MTCCLRRLVLFGLAWCGLGLPISGASAHKLRVLTSFLPVYCFTASVAGNLAEVENLLPANVEPHDYQFSRKDLQKLTRADLIVINGLGVEHWLEKAFGNSAHPQPVVELAAGLESQLIYSTGIVARPYPSSISAPNPHIWLDPQLACHGVTNVLKALQRLDPAHAGGYAANAAQYVAQLEKLDAVLKQSLGPIKGASIVTYHDAFPYFARRYGLHIVGVIESVPDVEPSLKSLASLYRSIRAEQVRVIFTEAPSPSRLAGQIAGDLRLPLASLETLESGALNRDTYEKAMMRNELALLKYLDPNAHRSSP